MRAQPTDFVSASFAQLIWVLGRQSVLDSVGGNQDKAIDKLLGMSDPEYKEQHSTNVVSNAQLVPTRQSLAMGVLSHS